MNEIVPYILASTTILLGIHQILLHRKMRKNAKKESESRVLQDRKILTGLKLSKAAYNKCKELEAVLDFDSTPEKGDERDFDSEGTSESST